MVLIIYPYHKQAGVILLIIVMVTHLPVFREKFADFITTDTDLLAEQDLLKIRNLKPRQVYVGGNKVK